MSVMDMNSRMAMAEKLSVQQLQQAVQSGSLPAYIGIPLIEQKTKEKAQMAAAQGGQQKPPSVAASILQQAEQQEQQERGIDELPSNLPMMEDEEMGMAGGGIVAFAAGTPEGVKDPEQDPRIIALRQDPAYLAFAESGGVEGDTSLTAFLQAGNTPTPPRAPLGRPTPMGMTPEMLRRIRADKNPEEMKALSSEAEKFAETIRNAPAPNIPAGAYNLTNPGTVPPTLTDKALNIPALQATMDPQLVASDMERRDFPPQATMAPQLVAPDMERRFPPAKNEGIDKLPVDKTAPQGGGGRPNALPPSLAAAERSDSPAANQATSMLDKYVAMLEKSGEDVGRQKKEALYMALIQGGLGMMGGTSPNAFANIAAGLLPATQAYQQAMRDIKKDDRARLEKLINAGLKKEEFLLKAEEIGVKRDTARMVYDAAMARTGAMGGSGGGNDIKTANAIRGLDSQLSTNLARVDTQIKNLNSANPMISAYVNKSPDQIPKGLRDQVAAYRTQLGKLEDEKNKWVNLHSSRVQSLGGATLGDIEGASGARNAPAVGTVKDGFRFKGGNPGDPKSWEKV